MPADCPTLPCGEAQFDPSLKVYLDGLGGRIPRIKGLRPVAGRGPGCALRGLRGHSRLGDRDSRHEGTKVERSQYLIDDDVHVSESTKQIGHVS